MRSASLWIESQARGSRDFHRFLHHRLRQPPELEEDPGGRPTISADLLGEGVVLIAMLRELMLQGAVFEPAAPAPDPAGFATLCVGVAAGLTKPNPGDFELASRLNRAATGQSAPRHRRAREEMAWHKKLAAQWFSGRLDAGCDLCGAEPATEWQVSGIAGEWK